MRRVASIFLVLLLLAACSPDYNWRQVSVADGAVMAFFPDKPISQSRELQFSGHEIEFGLTSATVDDTLFTVAYAALPPDVRQDEALRHEFATAVMRSLYRNMGLAEPDVLPALGEVFFIDGQGPQGNIRLQARVWLTGEALVEGLVMAAPEAFPGHQADQFLQGLETAR
ncbi:hypothetical protein [Pollutimonas harenae]|uniref:Lipoprotein n=1 Tax=Pollutimonas harenae TaxID=657015 RepID=A0A853GSD1_9BURK|nr:hypothetical protein [Pollutimonas harenae]NYT85067.1 hypothetical protein [Pollutimonas harenae]TEA72550.1 hypothetical protein ERD84_01145 [Pollutimonas harenae]